MTYRGTPSAPVQAGGRLFGSSPCKGERAAAPVACYCAAAILFKALPARNQVTCSSV